MGGIGALLFLSALADGFAHEENLFNIRKLEWEREQPDVEQEQEQDGEVLQIDPQAEVLSVPPAS